MPLFLEFNHIQKIITDYPEYTGINTFVESGTNVGRSIFHLAQYFKELHTIEIAEPLYTMCYTKAINENISNINFYLGDSLDILPLILKGITNPALFWLDGHYCRGNTGRGKIDPPMKEELQIILDQHNERSIIMIDNVDVFGRKGAPGEEDWSHISEESIMRGADKNKIYKSYVENDRLIILLKKV